jgi:16S rRNA processing protein RimM
MPLKLRAEKLLLQSKVIMTDDTSFCLGKIVRTHGIKGNLVILLNTDHPNRYKKTRAVFLKEGGLFVSRNISVNSLNGDLLNVHFEGVDSMTEAESLVGELVYLPLDQLPPLKGKQLYFHEAKGMLVIDEKEGELGKIVQIYDHAEQPVAEVSFNKQELLFPLIPEFIIKVDRKAQVLIVRLPDGLVDIYR